MTHQDGYPSDVVIKGSRLAPYPLRCSVCTPGGGPRPRTWRPNRSMRAAVPLSRTSLICVTGEGHNDEEAN